MSIEFELTEAFAAAPGDIYAAWLDSSTHSEMTGSPAQVSANVGEPFLAWDGYIRGRNLELETGRRIVQAWRTAEFDEQEPDSRLEITLEETETGTLLRLRHSRLPAHGGQYEQGWVENYFSPMRAYFESSPRLQ